MNISSRVIVLHMAFLFTTPLHAALLFSDNFDEHNDWQTTGRTEVGPLPSGWDSGRTNENWHPSDGQEGTRPAMAINGNDSSQVYGEKGKAFISYSESFNDTSNNGFTSDAQLTKDIPATNELYVKFQLKFQPGWAADQERGHIKIFRAAHWDGGDTERYKFFTSGASAPIYLYTWAQSDYGARHLHGFRCDPQLSNYYCVKPTILNPPRGIASGDMSANYTDTIAYLKPSIVDMLSGGNVPPSGVVYHNQVFGDSWHTMEYYLKLNSAEGVADGVFRHWIDGELIIDMDKIAWIGDGGNMNAKWNTISIGGNDRYHFNLTGEPKDRERWYSIDNLEVHDSIPVVSVPYALPKPPSNVRVQ